jgi:hypothetical protein
MDYYEMLDKAGWNKESLIFFAEKFITDTGLWTKYLDFLKNQLEYEKQNCSEGAV